MMDNGHGTLALMPPIIPVRKMTVLYIIQQNTPLKIPKLPELTLKMKAKVKTE
jgi:hypothetical protein